MATAVAFESVWDRVVRELDGPGLVDRLQMLDRERCHIEAELAELLCEVDRREVFRDDQHTSVKGWARALRRWSDGEARGRARLARVCDVFPQVAEALAGGTLGVSQALELGRVFANPRVRDQLVDVVDIFVAHAELMSFESFQQMVKQWESIADADGSHRDHEISHRRRKASMFVFGTSVIVQACGGSVDGAQMIEIFERYQHAEYLTDWAAARATYGADATAAQLPRDAGQRAWDALMKIFMDAASAPPGSTRPEPVLNIVADQHTFNEALQDFARLLANLDGVDGDGTIAEFLRNHHTPGTQPDASAEAGAGADADAEFEAEAEAEVAQAAAETDDESGGDAGGTANGGTVAETGDSADEIDIEVELDDMFDDDMFDDDIDDVDDVVDRPGHDEAAPGAEAATEAGADFDDDVDGSKRRDRWLEDFKRFANTGPPTTTPDPAAGPAPPARGIGGRTLDPRWWRCATVGGVPLPRSVLIEALLAGHVRRVIIDSAGVAVDVGRKRRFFTGPMRDALMLLTQYCVFAGCSRPSRQTVADHSHDFQHGGGTSTSNGAPMCNHHNLRKNLGYETWRDTNGHWHTHRPDGTEIR